MAERPSVEPLVWVSLITGFIALPLYLSGTRGGEDSAPAVFASAVLTGSAAFGFGSALLIAAYSGSRMHPASVLAAASGALVAGICATVLAAGMDGGLRIFAFSVLLVAGVGVAASRRAWEYANTDPSAAGPTAGADEAEGVRE